MLWTNDKPTRKGDEEQIQGCTYDIDIDKWIEEDDGTADPDEMTVVTNKKKVKFDDKTVEIGKEKIKQDKDSQEKIKEPEGNKDIEKDKDKHQKE